MKDRRYKAITPVTDFGVTQRIRVALIDAGHTDLAIEQITKPIGELEEAHALLKNRVIALEQEKVKWQTDSQVLETIKIVRKKTAGNWAIKAWAIVGGLALAAAGAAISRFIG